MLSTNVWTINQNTQLQLFNSFIVVFKRATFSPFVLYQTPNDNISDLEFKINITNNQQNI